MAACEAPQPDPVETILKRQVVQFTEPPKRTPDHHAVDASFHQIRVEGAFLVSAALQGEIVSPVTLLSEQGRELVMDNPWGDQNVTVAGSDD